MSETTANANGYPNTFEREVAGRFGVLPNFFCTAAAAPGLIEQLWCFAKSAYLDNPLPSLFKERLFVHLSRFCKVRYCIVRHVGFLAGLGRPAGDDSVVPHTLQQVLTLLRHPIASAAELDGALARLESDPAACRVPLPETPLEVDLLDALTVLFLDPVRSERARLAARRCMGDRAFEYAAALLAFIRAAHHWTETHPELTWEQDMGLLMEAQPELARLLLNDADADAVNPKQQLQRAMWALQNAEEGQAALRKALDTSENRMAAIFVQAGAGLSELSLEGRFIKVNDELCRILGRSRDELLTLSIADVTRPEDLCRSTEALGRVIETGMTASLDKQCVRPDGTPVWVNSTVTLLRNEQADPDTLFAVTADLTARNAAQNAQRASEERLRRVLETDAVAVLFFDHNGRLLDANNVFFQLTGYTRAEIEHGEFTWRTLTPREWVAISEEQWQKLARTGQIGPYEKEYILADGSRRWFLFTGRDLGDGTVAQFCVDVSDRKRVEQALRERETWLARQREALEAALTGAPLETSLGPLVRTATERLGGDTRAAFYIADSEGKTLHHVVGMSAAYAEAVNGFKIGPESLACGLAAHTDRPVITVDVTKEPRWAPWLGMAEKFDYRGCWSFPVHTVAGRFVGTFAIYSRQPREASPRDLEFAELVTQTAAIIIVRHTDAEERRRAETALRESEQNLSAVANIVPDLLWYSTPDGATHWYNDRWLEYTGQTFNQTAAWGWTEVIHPEDRESSARRYREAIEQGITVQQEQRIRRHDGEYRWFLIRAEPFHDERGRLVRMYGAATDIHEQRTARVRLEQEVASRTAELEIQVAERDALLQEVHHRVKNNLHVVNSMLEMQARRTEDYSSFQKLQEACNRVMSIAHIHELLYQSGSFSAVDLTSYAGRLVARLVDLYRVNDRVVAAVEGDSVGVDLERAVPCGLVLNELVSNACKHGFPEGVRGTLRVRLSRENGQIRLTVQDTGIGLPPGFDFRKSHSLGLRIVHLLAGQLQGAVTCASGRGACIELRFPASHSR